MLRNYLRNIYQPLKTVLIGMGITLKYNFARTVTVQYPDVPPTTKERTRGFHWFEIEKCSACGSCKRACPVDCIYIETEGGPRKLDRESGIVRGGAMKRWAIDYSKCMFCGLCCEPCPTECLHMGNIHDLSVFDRKSAIVEFTELAKDGLRTPLPIWLRQRRLPAWAERLRNDWIAAAAPRREEMAKALTVQEVKKPAPPPAAAAPASPKPETPAS